MSGNEISLKVIEAYTRDVGRGVTRIDYSSMDAINASTGDVVEIQGKGRTVAKCLPLYPADEDKGIIRIDGLGRNNSGMAIGDTITVRKVRAVAAEKVVVAPLEPIPPIDERYMADALEGVPLVRGDNVMVPYFGSYLTFQVIGVTPKADPLQVTQTTIFHIAEVSKDEANHIQPVVVLREVLNDLATAKNILESRTDPDGEKIKGLVDSTYWRLQDVEGKIHVMLGLSHADITQIPKLSEAGTEPMPKGSVRSGWTLTRGRGRPVPLRLIPKDQPVYMLSSSSAEEIAFVSGVLKSNDAPSHVRIIKESEQEPGNLFALILGRGESKTVTLAAVKSVTRSGFITLWELAGNLRDNPAGRKQ